MKSWTVIEYGSMKMKMIHNMYRYRDVRLLSKGLLAYAI
jgi:hypothetical protein